MNLTRLLCRVALIASGCASMWAQTAPLTPLPLVPNPVAPKPFQFDGSQYMLLLPGWPVILRPGGATVITRSDHATTSHAPWPADHETEPGSSIPENDPATFRIRPDADRGAFARHRRK